MVKERGYGKALRAERTHVIKCLSERDKRTRTARDIYFMVLVPDRFSATMTTSVSFKYIADKIGVSVDSVRRAVALLIDKNLVTVKRGNGRGHKTVFHYPIIGDEYDPELFKKG